MKMKIQHSKCYVTLLWCLISLCFFASLQASNTIKNLKTLPTPNYLSTTKLTLTLNDAIALALRFNPDIHNTNLNKITEKLNFLKAKNEAFGVTYGDLSSKTNIGENNKPVTTLTAPSINWTSPFGTKLALTSSQDLSTNGKSAQLTLSQPLLHQFGRQYALNGWYTAIDQRHLDQLNYRNSIASTLLSVIQAYRSVNSNFNQLEVSKKQLAQSERTLREYRVKLRYGQIPKQTLIEQQATIAQQKLSFLQSNNNYQNELRSFLTQLGINATTAIKLDNTIHIPMIHLPNEQAALSIAMKNNVSYLAAINSLKQAKRTYQYDKDNLGWNLSMTASTPVGGFNTTANKTVGVKLSIPIDKLDNKVQLENDQIGIETAQTNLAKAKRDLITKIHNTLQGIYNDQQKIKLDHQAIKLQNQTYQAAKVRLLHGLSTQFEVSEQQDRLIDSTNSLISNQTNLLNDIDQLYSQLGTELQHWHIKIKY